MRCAFVVCSDAEGAQLARSAVEHPTHRMFDRRSLGRVRQPLSRSLARSRDCQYVNAAMLAFAANPTLDARSSFRSGLCQLDMRCSAAVITRNRQFPKVRVEVSNAELTLRHQRSNEFA